MPIPEDNIVMRDPSSRTQLPFVIGQQKIGVVGRSRGRNVSDVVIITRSSGDTDNFPQGTKSPIRKVLKAVPYETTYDEDEYYPNIHFMITNDDTPPAILDPNNLGYEDDPVGLRIDWSIAPSLIPPSIQNITLQTSTGGYSSAATRYFAITVVDHNGVESNVGSVKSISIPSTTGYYVCVLTWRVVEYAKGYNVYRGISPDNLYKVNSELIPKGTVTFTDRNESPYPQVSPPTVNNTRAKVKNSDKYKLIYQYALITKNVPKEFMTSADVQDEHGVGSELSNIAKLYMDANYNNAPILVTVVPDSDSYNGYLDAVAKFQEHPVQHIIVLYAGSDDVSTFSTLFQPIYNLCASLSDEVNGQKECFAWTALPFKEGWTTMDIKTFTNAFQSTATKGKRGHLVVAEGHEVEVVTWQNPDGSISSNYHQLDPSGCDITPIIFAGACAARFVGLRDPAEPLTEKDIVGFSLSGRRFTTTEMKIIRSAGAMLVENISGVAVVNQSINMSLPVLGTEDGELNIAVAEDWIKSDMRAGLRQLRGRKMLASVLDAAKIIMIDKLRNYVDNEIIAYFDPRSVKAYQNPNQKTQILGTFEYMPIYPVNQMKVMYKFVFVALTTE